MDLENRNSRPLRAEGWGYRSRHDLTALYIEFPETVAADPDASVRPWHEANGDRLADE